MHHLIKNILSDIKVELTEEFDRNFERKAFFDKPWKQAKINNTRGSLMARSNTLSRGISSRIEGQKIIFSSDVPYAKIHNEGGEIKVNENMKAFFWAMHIKTKGAATGKGERAKNFSIESEQWKALALKKAGSKIIIEQRQFIGWHPSIESRINKIVNDNMKPLEQEILNILKQK